MNPRSHISRKHEYRRTLVQRGASIGANATIVCGHTLGEFAFIGAGAVVTSDVPAFALMVGVPARRVGWVCQCGVRLLVRGGAGECAACGAGYQESDGRLNLIVPPSADAANFIGCLQLDHFCRTEGVAPWAYRCWI